MGKRDPNLEAIIRALDPDLLPPPPPPPPFTGREVMVIGGPRARLAVCGFPAPSIEAWEKLDGTECFTEKTNQEWRAFQARFSAAPPPPTPRPDPVIPDTDPEPEAPPSGFRTVAQVFKGGIVRIKDVLGRRPQGEITRG